MGDNSPTQNIATHLGIASKISSEQTAIISAKAGAFQTRTFKELHEDVKDCAAYLKSHGISKGDHVLLGVKPGFQLILISFALFFLGAIPIIIDPGMGVRAFLKCIKNTQPSALIGISLMHLIGKFFPNSFKSIENKVLVRSKHFLKEIKQKKERLIPTPSTAVEEDLAAIVFTSGSTGVPKGVSYTHQLFNSQINHLKNNFGIQEGEKDLATLPIFALFNPALGVTSVIPDMNPRKPSLADGKKIVRTIQEFEITTAFASPVIGQKIYTACKSKNLTLPKVKRVFLAGAPSHPSLVEKLSNIISNGTVILPYGATEALPISATNHKDVKILAEDIAKGNGSCLGKPLRGNVVRIMPTTFSPFESGPNCPKEMDKGKVGEICVSGSIVSKEYFKMPGATFDSKFNDGKLNFHRMGDLGYFDSQGFLRFLGRKVERILTPDGPLETERCEPIINAIEGISRSALIGIGLGQTKQPCIVVELSKDVKKNILKSIKKEIHTSLKIRFPEHSFPYVVFEKSLPVDSRHNAKIHRLSLSKRWTKKVLKKPSKYLFS
ncbi:MAG: AMP-binding protein [Opitutae bacterium]|nr:AMP-binding protein [Opitutae bacterium]